MAEDKTISEDKKSRWRVSRRGFLIGAGVTGVGLALGWRYGLPELRLAVADRLDNAATPGGVEGAPTAWLEVSPDNTVTFYSPKVEMGQGVHTALAQLAAEELEVEWAQVQVASASTLRGLKDPFGTGGSSTVASLYTPLREAAASLREMIRTRAAETWGVEPVYVVAMNGTVFRQDDPDTKLTYGEVVSGAGEWTVPEDPPALKPTNEFRFIGKPMQRVDFREKLTGRAVYGYDARLPGMLYGAVARGPKLGATLKSAAAGDAPNQPGVVSVVLEDDFAGVVATSRTKAWKALEKLDLEWEGGLDADQTELERLVTVGNGQQVIIQREGRVNANLSDEVITAEYRSPMAAHAHLEPQAALVNVQPGKVTALVSTQSPQLVQGELAELLGYSEEEIEVTPTYLGGGFGRKLNVAVALEAARLSRAVGKPVHVGWNRSEEFQNGYLRPPTHSVLRASLNSGGTITAIEHKQASGDVAFPFFPRAAASVLGADFGAWRGARLHYGGVAHRRAVSYRTPLPLRTGWWRGLGLLANTFAVESFMDELALQAGEDGLAFRLRHLDDSEQGQRFKKVLQAAADAAGWDTPAPEGRARGIACSTDVGTVVAQVTEVSVENNQVRVHRVTCAVDPGFIVNPDGVKAQTQGAIVMGLSSTLKEAINVEDGTVAASNFDRYPLLTMAETPEIEVVLLESSDTPHGMGEPPIGPIAAATANAVAALTGQRLRSLPLKVS